MDIRSNTHPITSEEFIDLLDKIKKRYVKSIKKIYLKGNTIDKAIDGEKISKRALQENLSKHGYSYRSLRYGYIASKLAKGFTIKSIREGLGLAIRDDLNVMMWEKVRGDVRPSKRWKVLRRDNFRCVLCGADATDRKLHIDHIIPVVFGGTSKIKNLRVLCNLCNLGRKNKMKKHKRSEECK